jgi:hypothetical protein
MKKVASYLFSHRAVLVFLAGALLTSLLINPTHAATLSISSAIPGTNFTSGSAATPGVYIANFYQLALLLGGVLAVGGVVYGGVLYAASAGNSSRQSEGKEWIEAALLGLLLLAGAYVILNTINPNLTNLNLPTVSIVNPASQ